MDANFITHKLGPFPLWAWIGVSVAGLIVWTQLHPKAAVSVPKGTAGLSGTSAANLPNGTAFDPQGLTVVNEGYNPPSVTINNAPMPDVVGRQPQFSNFVIDYKRGEISGVNADSTLTGLTPAQWSVYDNPYNNARAIIVNKDGTPAPASAPIVAPVAPSAPAPRTVTVAPWTAGNTPWNSTLSGIAQHYYNDASQYMRIAQANGIANPDLIHPGQQILVP
jgi:hypothetical protein